MPLRDLNVARAVSPVLQNYGSIPPCLLLGATPVQVWLSPLSVFSNVSRTVEVRRRMAADSRADI
jgi:hypothetical protein